MYLNLRSPWTSNCSRGCCGKWNGRTCERDQGAQYDVFVSESCVPEQGYVTEMQDTSAYVSKQIKIYLRRDADYYITVQRRGSNGTAAPSECSFGLSLGSVEGTASGTGSSGTDLSSSCYFYGSVAVTQVGQNASQVPWCRDVMPAYTPAARSDGGVQAVYVASLVGVGGASVHG
eukprot:CAMPEP_0113700772 /NCGR_PEP_ID=MMETSP0038_2-20120614/24167_1 /TAXON_ID=2898 /ORGANISM="Cryptomonas paramecium" /LENGTH=174 /DNA_ID=CAMNT_0000624515 /DNA_START=756 /DNA_END=1279 /DNA_ORIENTATION=- /assembly_acc=CAM_ASM_000170